MIRKFIASLALAAGLFALPGYAYEQTQAQPSVPNMFDPAGWAAFATPDAGGSQGGMNFMNPTTWMSAFGGQPTGAPQLNLATPGGWTVFMNPATYPALMNPATYGQFMSPAFYMQFANPNNWMSWMNPAAYGPWMNPMTYAQWMNPMAYMAFMNPATYMNWMNPANYAAFMNPATYMQWMNPAAYDFSAITGGTDASAFNFFDPNAWMQYGQSPQSSSENQ